MPSRVQSGGILPRKWPPRPRFNWRRRPVPACILVRLIATAEGVTPCGIECAVGMQFSSLNSHLKCAKVPAKSIVGALFARS